MDLGLRSSEVVKLQLDDINWADGTIKLVGTKSGRADALPLPSETGAGIAAYLHEERPATSNRAIFVRHGAPYDEPITTKSVKRAVLAGYPRCGYPAHLPMSAHPAPQGSPASPRVTKIPGPAGRTVSSEWPAPVR
ncbi:tyrosine-type recombinase/integrase [Mesorhizobium sp. C420B]|uniref:tyrosine-type recombinase/integrase n=1 Tax=Mesorhizobium sp. C420B TaxID=2956835 RepID=UPI00333B561D